VVLAHTKGMESDGVRQLGLFEQLAQHAGMRLRASVRILTDITERVQAQ
jgi:hypothetical protein